jgi:taurine---2-oxoglutarate transaminase
MLAQLERLQQRHEVIGEVRGGHGLFAVVELVRDRATRAPLAPWPQQPPALRQLLQEALRRGVSFAARGNLLLLAPPLVIRERELGEALDLLDTLLGDLARDLKGSRS